MASITTIRLFPFTIDTAKSDFHSRSSIKSEYNIGRYQNPSRTIEDYRVITDNGSLNLEIDYADYKDQIGATLKLPMKN